MTIIQKSWQTHKEILWITVCIIIVNCTNAYPHLDVPLCNVHVLQDKL